MKGGRLDLFFNPFVSYGVNKCCNTASAEASRDWGSSVQTPRYCTNSRALLLFHHLWMGAEPLRSPEWANLPKLCRAGAQLTCQPFAQSNNNNKRNITGVEVAFTENKTIPYRSAAKPNSQTPKEKDTKFKNKIKKKKGDPCRKDNFSAVFSSFARC